MSSDSGPIQWRTWYGWIVLMAILTLECVGILWIRRVAAIEV